MRRAALIACCVSAVLAVPAAADASVSTTTLYGSVDGAPIVEQRSAPLSATGQLTVDFHGDAAADCAQLGVCGYSGWVAWRPASGTLQMVGSRSHGHLRWAASLQLDGGGPGPTQSGSVTTADVQRTAGTGAGTCLDAEPAGTEIPLAPHGAGLSLDLAHTVQGLLGDRCAGPRAASLLPSAAVPRSVLERGLAAVSLTASHPFSADGFTGTVQSTVVLRIGRLGRVTRVASGQPFPGRRYRQLTVDYRASIAGSIVERFAGAPAAAICGPLDSCGASGAITLAPNAHGRAQLSLMAPASVPAARLLAAVGIGRAAPAGAYSGFGQVQWSAGGTLASAFDQGSVACRDSSGLGGDAILLAVARGRGGASYLKPLFAFDGPPPGTVCPGPVANAGLLGAPAAPQSVALTRRTITIALRTGFPSQDDGYSGTITPRLTLRLTRVGAHLHIIRLPPGVIP
ncbi:MAG: hypothetical protein ACRDMX_06535 [Solirubrobacteraceae bacterium]